jgi:hypothetical protein
MTNSKTHIRFPTHAVYCEVKGDRIYIFKYADHGCDYEVFEAVDQLGASDYIVEPLNQIHYRVAFPGESE